MHPTSQTSLFGSQVMFVESFSVRVFTVKTLLFSPWNLLLNSCSTEAKSEWTFFLGLRWIKLVSAPRQHRSAFEPELNLLENVPFFQLGDRHQGHSYQNTLCMHIWKSLCTKKIYYINKFLRFSGNRHLGGEGKKVRYLEKSRFQRNNRGWWIEANCALKIIVLRYFAFFLEWTFSFLLFIDTESWITYTCTSSE